MKLAGTDGQSFELEVAGYQFPEESLHKYDSNWLLIRVNVEHPRGRWSAQDPSLLTSEVAELADWLEALASGASEENDMTFTEPNLSFRLVESAAGPALRVYFELEIRPSWAASRGAGMKDLWVELPLSELDLRDAAASLRSGLERFPHRGHDL